MGWLADNFDDSNWERFATGNNIDANESLLGSDDGKRTLVRARFDNQSDLKDNVGLRIVGHGEIAVYLNGKLIKKLASQVFGGYEETKVVPATAFVFHEEAKAALKEKDNLLAIEITPVVPKRGYSEPKQKLLEKYTLLDLELVSFD